MRERKKRGEETKEERPQRCQTRRRSGEALKGDKLKLKEEWEEEWEEWTEREEEN